MTRGCTGDIIDDNLNPLNYVYVNDEVSLNQIINNLKELFNNESMNSIEFTQFLRAEAFSRMDKLLNSLFFHKETIDAVEFNIVEHFLATYLSTYCKWVEKIHSYGDMVVHNYIYRLLTI